MSRIDRRAVIMGGAAGLLAGCSIGDDLAGGSRKQPKGGIGGTGIVGTLTDFGSLIVNGLRVNVPTGLVVGSAVGAVAQDQLSIGQTLTIEAETITGGLIARRVEIVYPVIGKLQDVSADSREMVVAGVRVFAEPGAILSGRVGEQVAVSGVWNLDAVVASRVSPLQTEASIVLAGTLRRQADESGWRIGAMPVLLRDDAGLQDGSFATAYGYRHGGMLNVTSLRSGRFTGAAGALTALSVEGFLAPSETAPFHTVDGLGHSFSDDSQLDPFIGQRVLFKGGYDGAFRLQQGVRLAEEFDARRKQLRV